MLCLRVRGTDGKMYPIKFFKGEKGDKGDNTVYVGPGEMPEGYNVQIDTTGNPEEIADCVIEQGTNGIWTYRKWESGISECWASVTYNAGSIIKVGNDYFYGVIGVKGHSYEEGFTFPNGLFVSKPYMQYSVANDAGKNSVGIGQGLFKAVRACPTKDATGCLYFDTAATVYIHDDWTVEPSYTGAQKITFAAGQYIPIYAAIEAKGRWK